MEPPPQTLRQVRGKGLLLPGAASPAADRLNTQARGVPDGCTRIVPTITLDAVGLALPLTTASRAFYMLAGSHSLDLSNMAIFPGSNRPAIAISRWTSGARTRARAFPHARMAQRGGGGGRARHPRYDLRVRQGRTEGSSADHSRPRRAAFPTPEPAPFRPAPCRPLAGDFPANH